MKTAPHVVQAKLLRLYKLDVMDVERGGQPPRVLILRPARLHFRALSTSLFSIRLYDSAEVIDDLKNAVEAAKMTGMFLNAVLGKVSRSHLLPGFLR